MMCVRVGDLDGEIDVTNHDSCVPNVGEVVFNAGLPGQIKGYNWITGLHDMYIEYIDALVEDLDLVI